MRMDSPRSGLPLAAALATAAWFGMLAGYGELVYQAVRKYHLRLFLFQSPDIVWLTPLAEAGLFAGVTLIGFAVIRALGRRPTVGHVTAWCTALAGMALLFLFPPLHKGAAVLIAIGLGVRLGRSGAAVAPWGRRLVRRTLPVLAGVTVMTAVTMLAMQRMHERKALAGLPAARAGAPNVLLIILDTVRALDLSLYGYARPTTPRLQQRATTAVRFDRAFSTAPWSLPSHASIFTGLDAHELATDWYVPLDDTTPTLAEALRDRGWRTGGFVANLPYTSREVGLGRGFIRYEDYPLSFAELAASSSVIRAIAASRGLRERLNWHQLLVSKPAPEINAALLRWVDRDRERPFFAFLNYYDAHKPVVPPEPYASRFLPPGSRSSPIQSAARPTRSPGIPTSSPELSRATTARSRTWTLSSTTSSGRWTSGGCWSERSSSSPPITARSSRNMG